MEIAMIGLGSVLCVIGYQAHRSRSVKTATDGRRHRDTYTNKTAPKNADKY